MDNIAKGRSALRAWEDSKPDNFYTADANLQHVLRHYLGNGAYDAAQPNLINLGAEAATLLDADARVEDQIGNHPRLERWTGIGERAESIVFHPNHDRAGELIWRSGVLALQGQPGRVVEQMGLYYLLAHNGEGGHLCALACTSGLIRALQQAAAPEIREQFLPPLLRRAYDNMQHGAQFLTEVQGGSDVGANAVTARPASGGTWRISGEKWFCSNVNADQFLMTARPEGAPAGTRGLGLFLVPRRLPDGRVNGFAIRRLKDKLGTRTLASVELDFDDALAYPVGPLDRGFKNTVELVLNTSRLLNAVACAGIMRRAYIEAATYACQRTAFGAPIISYPLVQEALADIAAEYYAATASGFYLAHLLDQIETGRATDDENGVYRLLVSANKYLTSVRASAMVHRAIEVLGGNGAIESFSVLPRLYRDMVVLESWEGTHNVLCLQVVRDIARYDLHLPYERALRALLARVTSAELAESVEDVSAALDRVRAALLRLNRGGERYAQAHARRFTDLLMQTAQAALLLAEAQRESERGPRTPKADVLAHFIARHLHPDSDPLTDDSYLARVERLAAQAL